MRARNTPRRLVVATMLSSSVVLAAAAVSCAPGDKAAATDTTAVGAAAPTVVTIVASDYSYDAPDTISAGMVTLRLVNNGPEMHHVQLLRLTDGKTYADLEAGLKTMQPGAPMPPWIHEVAGPNTPVPGGEVSLIEELPAGNYAIMCMIPSPDHVPHFAKGMMRPLTVIPATGARASAPTADVTVSMSDYAWQVSPALTAGKHMIKLENSATQAHEMVLLLLAPGKTSADFLQWFEKQEGPPPAKPMGGISGLAKGDVAYLPVDLPAGEYALLCFLPDVQDGKPHIAHGMVTQLTVQ